MHNSDNPVTKRVIPRVDTAPQGVETQPRRPIADWLGLENKASANRERQVVIPGLEIPPYIYNSDNFETKTVISRVEPAPHGAETTPPPTGR